MGPALTTSSVTPSSPPLSAHAASRMPRDRTGIVVAVTGMLTFILAFDGSAGVALWFAIMGAAAGLYRLLMWPTRRAVRAENCLDFERSRFIAKAAEELVEEVRDVGSLKDHQAKALVRSASLGLRVLPDLRLGEFSRHFDTGIRASVGGWMEHNLSPRGLFAGLRVGPLGLAVGSGALTGASRVDLSIDGFSRIDLTNDGFMAVFDRSNPGAPETTRVVAPSEAAALEFLERGVQGLGAGFEAGSHSTVAVEDLSRNVTHAARLQTSHAADRLSAILRLPPGQRPPVTVYGHTISDGCVLGFAIRFGDEADVLRVFPTDILARVRTSLDRAVAPALTTGAP